MSVAGTITSEAEESAETLARWKWCGVIFGFLGLQILISSVAIFLATSDPSNVIVEGYYEQAVSWDEHRETQAASDALGWSTVVTLDSAAQPLSKSKLELALTDRNGFPVKASQLDGQLFHHARAGDVYQIHFSETSPGHYAALAPLQKPGLWELALTAAGDEGTFQEKKQFLLKDSGEWKPIEAKQTHPTNANRN